MNEIPEFVKRTMHDQHLNLNSMSIALGITKQAVHNWTTGKTRPDKYFLVKLLQNDSWKSDFAKGALEILDPTYWKF